MTKICSCWHLIQTYYAYYEVVDLQREAEFHVQNYSGILSHFELIKPHLSVKNNYCFSTFIIKEKNLTLFTNNFTFKFFFTLQTLKTFFFSPEKYSFIPKDSLNNLLKLNLSLL